MSFFKKWLGNLTELKSHAEIAAMLHQAVQDAGMDCGVPELGATANDTYLPLASGRVARHSPCSSIPVLSRSGIDAAQASQT